MKTNVEIIEFIKGQMKALVSFGEIGTDEWRTFLFIINENLDENERTEFFADLKSYKESLEKRP